MCVSASMLTHSASKRRHLYCDCVRFMVLNEWMNGWNQPIYFNQWLYKVQLRPGDIARQQLGPTRLPILRSDDLGRTCVVLCVLRKERGVCASELHKRLAVKFGLVKERLVGCTWCFARRNEPQAFISFEDSVFSVICDTSVCCSNWSVRNSIYETMYGTSGVAQWWTLGPLPLSLFPQCTRRPWILYSSLGKLGSPDNDSTPAPNGLMCATVARRQEPRWWTLCWHNCSQHGTRCGIFDWLATSSGRLADKWPLQTAARNTDQSVSCIIWWAIRISPSTSARLTQTLMMQKCRPCAQPQLARARIAARRDPSVLAGCSSSICFLRINTSTHCKPNIS